MGRKLGCGLAITVLAMLGVGGMTGVAHADAVIASGDIRLGVNDEGHLNIFAPGIAINTSFVGLTYLPTGDATSPGCLCEGWGVSANGVSGYANVSVDGVVNLTVDSFTSTASTATSVVHLSSLPGLSVKQEYFPSSAPGALFEDKVTITNTTGATATDVRYTRVMDWDVPPTEFSEFVTIGGLPATNVLFTSDNGFATANPLGTGRGDIGGCPVSANFTDCGASDHGALFDFGFGALADGESRSFSIFYGATPTESGAFAALGAVGAEVYSLGQSNTVGGPTDGTPATYIFAFKGVGGTPVPPVDAVPEPGTLLLMGSGLVGFLKMRRKVS
jgi:type IV pilus assembly protein PilY1